ncbi:MAG: ComF family protein, partial [Planctomycetota bacterium]
MRTRSLRRPLRELLRALTDAVCPPHCPACGGAIPGPGAYLCPGCREQLSVRHMPWCHRCGSPLLPGGDRCAEDHRPLAGIALARAPFRYAGTAGELVRRGKFQHDRSALAFLARAMAGTLSDWALGAGRRAVVVSVPLHPKKRRRRGLDQAAVLAELVAARLRLVHVTGVMTRVRDTLAQGDVRVTSRERNVAGAFRVR